MKTNQIRLELKDFRAIKEANIILDGITVVAGENGSGKSTLSKFLYYVFKTSNEYEDLIFKELRRNLSDVSDVLDEVDKLIEWYEERISKSEIETLQDAFRELRRDPSFSTIGRRLKLPLNSLEDESIWLDTVEKLFANYSLYFHDNTDERTKVRLNRVERIIEDLFIKKDGHNIEFEIASQKGLLYQIVHELFNEAKKKIEERPVYPFINSLYSAFTERETPKEYSVLEYDVPIVDVETISTTHSIRKTAYVDTPMALGAYNNKFKHWTDINIILSEKEDFGKEVDLIDNIIKNEIIKGDTFYEAEAPFFPNSFFYEREDGREFNLLDCATGVKSFAMLQMMLKNGFLDKYTLLIIDEPESHLHPQWIIEYARLIVLLNKHIGVKFFIASHNPDMVSAIKYISEKEEVDNNLNYYIAEREGDSYQYLYRQLGTDIEPIFESFNIALDRINQYGTKEGAQ